MVVGILVGTYSTIFIAMPARVSWWAERCHGRRQGRARARARSLRNVAGAAHSRTAFDCIRHPGGEPPREARRPTGTQGGVVRWHTMSGAALTRCPARAPAPPRPTADEDDLFTSLPRRVEPAEARELVRRGGLARRATSSSSALLVLVPIFWPDAPARAARLHPAPHLQPAAAAAAAAAQGLGPRPEAGARAAGDPGPAAQKSRSSRRPIETAQGGAAQAREQGRREPAGRAARPAATSGVPEGMEGGVEGGRGGRRARRRARRRASAAPATGRSWTTTSRPGPSRSRVPSIPRKPSSRRSRAPSSSRS